MPEGTTTTNKEECQVSKRELLEILIVFGNSPVVRDLLHHVGVSVCVSVCGWVDV